MFKPCDRPNIKHDSINEVMVQEHWYKYKNYYGVFELYEGIYFASIIKDGEDSTNILPHCLSMVKEWTDKHDYIGLCFKDTHRGRLLGDRIANNFKEKLRLVENGEICVIIERK